MTKERKEYFKAYYQANKEKAVAYYQENKEKIAAYDKKYQAANKEKIAAYRDSFKDGFYTVYYLQEEHYVGMTNSLYYRLKYHKSKHKRHVEDVEVIGKYETKAEALRVEAALHSMGYLGGHPQLKQQTLRELI